MWPPTSSPGALGAFSVLSFILPAVLADGSVQPLEGYGGVRYPLPCGGACEWTMPTVLLVCPEYANMTEEELIAATPSAECLANNEPYLTSMAWCIHSNCPKDTKVYQVEKYWSTTMITNVIPLLYTYSEALAKTDPKNPPELLSAEEPAFNRTIAVAEDAFQLQWNTIRNIEVTSINASKYSLVVCISCLIIPIAFSFLRFLRFPVSLRRKFNGYFIDPPAWGTKHLAPTLGLGLVPTSGQAFFIVYIIAINAVATFEGYPLYEPFAVTRHYAWMRLIGNRAGIIAFANIPVLMLYSGRNSLLLYLTNWSQSTFLLLHRWVGVICVIQVALHSLLWLRIMVEGNLHSVVVVIPYWYWGIFATCVFCLIIPMSVLPLRQAMYEVFLISHILLSMGAIIGSWYHIMWLYGVQGGFEVWLIIACVFWSLDRFLRIFRFSRHGVKKAYVTRIDSKYLRVDIPDIDASGHCYVYFPSLSWRVWENHPFSVVPYCGEQPSESEKESGSNSLSGSQVQVDTQGAVSTEDPVGSKEAAVVSSIAGSETSKKKFSRPGITLFVQEKRGFTAKLAKKANSGVALPVLVEASYGNTNQSHFSPTAEYPNTLVIAGGVGIAGVISALKASISLFSNPVGTTKLYWGIKQRGLVDAVKSIIVGQDASKEEGHGEPSQWGHIEAHVTIGSRMDLKEIITREVEQGLGGTTVIVCGPNTMCDDVRVICSALARHGGKVRYVEEAFSW